MARTGITFDQVVNAAETLIAQGKNPTIAAVRQLLGGGSPNNVHAHLTAWRENKPTVEASKRDLPASLTAALAAAIADAEAQVTASMHDQLEQATSECDALSIEVGRLEDTGQAAAETIAILTHERDALQANTVILIAERDKAESTAAEKAGEAERAKEAKVKAEVERDGMQTRMQELHGYSQGIQGQVDGLRVLLDTERTKRIDAEKEHAVMAAKLAAAEQAADLVRQDNGKLEAKLDAAVKAAQDAIKESAALREKLASIKPAKAAAKPTKAKDRPIKAAPVQPKPIRHQTARGIATTENG